jgi:putative flavoprotein involved in K+ transport
VVASGPKNVPLVPEMAANLAPHLNAINADDYRNAGALPEGAVLVVGGGQSGGQIAEDLALGGRSVWWSTSRIGRYRARYRGRALLDWHVDAGWWATPPEAVPDPAAKRAATPLIASNGHDLGIPKLGRMGVNLLGRLAEVDESRLGFAGDVNAFVAYGDEVAGTLETIADDYIAAAGLDAPPASPDDGRGPVDAPARPSLDLDREGITTVIWSTGFGGDYRWLGELDNDAYGFPLLDPSGAALGDPAVRFVGMPWQSTRASAILHGMPLDVRRAVDGVTDQLASR